MQRLSFLFFFALWLTSCGAPGGGAPATHALSGTKGPTATLTPAPTLTFTLQPTSTRIATPTETPVFSPPPETTVTAIELSSEQLAEKKFVGSGFELKTEFQGIPVDFTVVTSKASLTQYKQTRGCMPNQEMVKYGASAEDRMAEMVFLGHYVGYLRYSGRTEAGYPFTQYIADLKAGRDRSYSIWGPRLDGTDGEWIVDPLKPVEYVTTNAKVDPDGNGRGTAYFGGASYIGFQQLENGGLRIVKVIGYTSKDYFYFCVDSSNSLASLLLLGNPLKDMQGRWQITAENLYPATKAKLYADPVDMQTYNNSNGLIKLAILVP
jgi:hypothetical protein